MTPIEIKALRQRLGDTQEDFARRLGITLKTAWNWEAGASSPRSRAHTDRLAQVERLAPKEMAGAEA